MSDRLLARHGGVYKKAMLAIAIILGLAIVLVVLEYFAGASAKLVITDRYSAELERLSLDRQAEYAGDAPNAYEALAAIVMDAKAANDQLFNELLERADEQGADADDPWAYDAFEPLYFVPDEGTPEQFEAARRRGVQALQDWEARGIFARTADLPALGPVARPATKSIVEDLMLPYTGASRTLARAQAARGRVAAEAGDHATLVRATDETLALGRHMGNHGYLIDWLVGVAVQELARSSMLDSLLLHPASDETVLQDLDAAIEREMQHRMPTLADALRGERLFSLDSFQHFFTDDGRGGGRFLPLQYARHIDSEFVDAQPSLTPFGDRKLSNLHGRLYLGRRATIQWFEGLYQRQIAAAEANSDDSAARNAELARYVDAVTWRNPVAQNSSIFFGTSRQVERRRRIQAAGTRVLLAIERYRLQHGAPPPTLGDLGDLLPDDLQNDPYTNQPWHYEPSPVDTMADGQPLLPGAHAWPYTLRSQPMPGHTPNPPEDRGIDPRSGVLIAMPIQGPQYDMP
ncbi:MAG: hypothetical protein RIE77_02770 [Phycisphaerales bacterium]|jgi:hypothetical protein